MRCARVAFIPSIICGLFIVSMLPPDLSTIRMDGQPSSFELSISPSSDLDPYNGTSIAVSPKNDQIIVGASKVAVGGGGPTQRGITQISYYYSSDGGRAWGSG